MVAIPGMQKVPVDAAREAREAVGASPRASVWWRTVVGHMSDAPEVEIEVMCLRIGTREFLLPVPDELLHDMNVDLWPLALLRLRRESGREVR